MQRHQSATCNPNVWSVFSYVVCVCAHATCAWLGITVCYPNNEIASEEISFYIQDIFRYGHFCAVGWTGYEGAGTYMACPQTALCEV